MEKATPSIPTKVSFKEFKNSCHISAFGSGARKMFHVYYGKDDEYTPYWNFLVYPYGYCMIPYDRNTSVNALKQAYKVLFEETRPEERQSAIREGKFKFAMSYKGNTDFQIV